MNKRSAQSAAVGTFLILILTTTATLWPQTTSRRGYIRISTIPESSPPFGFALISYRDSTNTLIGQAAVEAHAPRTSGSVFVDGDAGRTLMTLTNTGTATTTAILTLHDARGSERERRSVTIGSGQQMTVDANDTFGLPADFLGSLRITSSNPIAIDAARERTDASGGPTASVPVVDDPTGGPPTLTVPILTFTTLRARELVLQNPSRVPLRGEIAFVESGGSSSGSSVTYTVEPNAIAVIPLPSEAHDRYAVVTAESGQPAPGIAVVTSGPAGTGQPRGAIPGTRPARSFRGVVETIGTETRIVVTNPETRPQELTFQLLDRFGDVVANSQRTLDARRLQNVRVEELFPSTRFGFSGQFEVRGDSLISVVSVRQTINSRAEEVVAFMPVSVDGERRRIPLIAPFVSGNGAETRLLLMNRAELNVRAEAAFLRADGTPLEVADESGLRSVVALNLDAGSRQQLFPDNPGRPTVISLRDPVSNQTTSEIVVNAGSTVRAPVLVLDDAGTARDDFKVSLTSLSGDVAGVDDVGNVTGRAPGFSTITIAAGARVVTATVTVVAVDYGGGGYEITGVGQDLNRRVYLAAANDHVVLIADGITQTPKVWAGNLAIPGFRNDLRLLSLFREPSFLAVNQFDGSVYASDTANHVIRRIRSGTSGAVETLAGSGGRGVSDGTGTEALFAGPQGIALDARGFLWIADSLNHTIRRMNVLTRRVQTIAGMPAVPGSADGVGNDARFFTPTGLAVETETITQQLERERRGEPPPPVRVIVADTGNGLLRRVSETGAVETVSRLGTASGTTRELVNGRQRALGMEPIRLDAPVGVAVDPAGNIFVSEAASRQVRTVLPNGDVVPAAQAGTFVSPRGLALAESGRLLVGDRGRPLQEVRFGAPEISAISPNRVGMRGGVSVVVRGRNFAPETRVIVGGAVITDVNVRSTEAIEFLSPLLPSGLTTVTVLNRGGIAQRSFLIEPVPLTDLEPGQITTVAGGSTFTGDGGQAGAAVVSIPDQMAVDAVGNLYIADSGNHRVRRVDRISGVITTVAGNGSAGFSGDGSFAVAASFIFPEGVAIDASGNVFVGDTGNSRIRRIDAATGLISTVAGSLTGFSGDGGPATSARLNAPRGLAFDRANRLIVADSGNHRIRRIETSGVISTIAGNERAGFVGEGVPAAEASLNSPRAIAVDGQDRLWIADTFNHRVRRIEQDGTIHTIAGTGEASFSGDGEPATSAAFNSPYGMAFDPSGSVWIADSRNHRIRRIDVRGIVQTIAGTGAAGFAGDGERAAVSLLNEPRGLVSAGNDVIVSDRSNHRVRRIGEADGPVSPFGVSREVRIATIAGTGQRSFDSETGDAAATTLRSPLGLAVDGAGNVYVSDSANHRVLVVTAGRARTLAGTGTAGSAGDGYRAASAMLNFPQGLAADRFGNVYVADTGNHRVRRIGVDGTIRTFAGSGQPGFGGDGGAAVTADLLSPSDVAVDDAGNLYIADTGNGRVRKVDGVTGRILTIAGDGTFAFSGDGGPADRSALNAPRGVAVDAAGNVFIADAANHRVRRVDVNSRTIQTVAGSGQAGFSGDGNAADQATLNFPTQIAVDGSGSLIFVDTFNHRIRGVSAMTGTITTIAGNGQRGFSGDGGSAVNAALFAPSAVRLDAEGNVFFADTTNERIRAVRRPPLTHR